MQKKYADQGLQIIAVNLDKEAALIEKFLHKTLPQFPIAYDASADMARKFAVKSHAQQLSIRQAGTIGWKTLGFSGEKKIGL